MAVRALPMHRLGGLEFHTLDLVNALARRGHRVVVLTSAAPEIYLGGRVEAGVTVRHIPLSRPGDYSLSFFRQVPAEIAKLHAEFTFDLVHAQDFAGLLVRELPVPLLVTIHGTLTSETPLDRRYMRHLTRRQKWAARWRYRARLALLPPFRRMLQRADALLVDSDYTRRELLLEAPDLGGKLNLVPLGIDWSRYSPVEPAVRHEGSPRIALLGRIQEMKGMRQAVLAADGLRRRGVPFTMRIAGAGDYQGELLHLVSQLQLEDYVQLVGRVPDAQLPQFLAENDVFLFPDLTQPAFGLVALEAMHHGLPVVGARSGAIPEVVDETSGWLYDPWDVPGLTALLARVLANPQELARRAQGAKARAEGFTAEAMAEQTEAAYLRALG